MHIGIHVLRRTSSTVPDICIGSDIPADTSDMVLRKETRKTRGRKKSSTPQDTECQLNGVEVPGDVGGSIT